MLEDEPGTSAQDTPIWDNRLVGGRYKVPYVLDSTYSECSRFLIWRLSFAVCRLRCLRWGFVVVIGLYPLWGRNISIAFFSCLVTFGSSLELVFFVRIGIAPNLERLTPLTNDFKFYKLLLE